MHMFSLAVMHVFPEVRASRAAGPTLAGLILMAAGLVGLRQGLAPFRRLRQTLTAVRAGKDRRNEGAYPCEIQPLIDDLNALLESARRP
jgi:hypothetical protein